MRGWTDIAGLDSMSIPDVLHWNRVLDAVEDAETE